VVLHTCNPAFGRWRKKDLKLENSSDYIASSRPTCATQQDPVLKEKERAGCVAQVQTSVPSKKEKNISMCRAKENLTAKGTDTV
jgi:hypothetical protein